jgi:CRP/FNR family cyclic AMP-dependent transcriptional regulator
MPTTQPTPCPAGSIDDHASTFDVPRVGAIRFFADLPDDELVAVAGVASEVEIPSGQALAAEGRIGHSLLAVESGTADVVIAGATVGTIGPGDVVGEAAILAAPPDPFAPAEVAEGGLRTASVIATSPMRLITLFKRDVWALDRRAPGATKRLRALLDERRVQNAKHTCRAGSIDDYAPTFDVTDTLVVKVDADPEAVGAALEHLDLTASVAAAVSAFGGADRIALAPALLAAQPGRELVFGLVWRYEGPTETVDPARFQTFDTPGHVKLIWDLRVEPGALEGAFLSMTRRFAATDEATRARLLDSWGIIGTVADSLARRIVAAVKAHAED